MAERLPARFIAFLSDYGTADEFVGVCHSVIASIAPDVRVIDLAHGVRGVRAAAASLAQAVPYSPDAVHLAIVDPGVGTDRRAIVALTPSGGLFVGPDNGLLLPAMETMGGPAEAFELADPAYRLEPVSPTFQGRDVFAPAAAHLARGVAPESFGPRIDPASLFRLEPAWFEAGDGWLEAEVLREDNFGNVQLAARGEDLAKASVGLRAVVHAGAVSVEAESARTFADAPAGQLVVYIDASGHAALAVNLGSAAERLGHPTLVRIERSEYTAGSGD